MASDRFEWDEVKRHMTLEKHGIDFIDAIEIFDLPFLRVTARSETEQREIAIGFVQNMIIAVVFTGRGDVTRIITARRARRNEREAYEAYVAGRTSPDEGQD
ncbi:BrnT family toxin [uncultured Paracoccus sp.]|uniref:BrnT family toxin n=1 Tax=uncultured Paracoccus sp. TaxID=189685 RepID=UPI0026163193|nr:BrnT family toxin [uncultured Paracoccus sp.]